MIAEERRPTAFAVRIETPQGPRFVAFDENGKLLAIVLGSTAASGMEALLWPTRGRERICSPELVAAGHGHWRAADEGEDLELARLGVAWAVSIGTKFGRIPPAWLMGGLLGKIVGLRNARAWTTWAFRNPVRLTSHTILEDGRERDEEWTVRMTSDFSLQVDATRAKTTSWIVFHPEIPEGTKDELARAGIDRWPVPMLVKRGKAIRYKTDAELVELATVIDAAIGAAEEDDGEMIGSTLCVNEIACSATVMPDYERPRKGMLN